MGDNRAKTLRELAKRLDLSITTVSRALAGHEQIALKTRQRVSLAAREHGYVPNGAARQLVSGRSGFVGLLMPIRGPNFVDSYLGEFITGLGEGLVSHGLDLFLATVQQGQNELEVLRHVVHALVFELVLLHPAHDTSSGPIRQRRTGADEDAAFTNAPPHRPGEPRARVSAPDDHSASARSGRR